MRCYSDLNLQRFNDRSERSSTALNLLLFRLGQRRYNRLGHTVGTDYIGNAQAHVMQSVLPVQQAGYGKHGSGISDNTCANPGNGESDCIICSAFFGDNLSAGSTNIFFDFLQFGLAAAVVATANFQAVFIHGNAADGCEGPGDDGSVAVFAQHLCVDVFRIESHVFRQAGAQTG